MKKYLYNFGISQDDAETERKALSLENGDRLVCIASAGEVPLNLLASTDIDIDAVDISESQLRLTRLKQLAALRLDPEDAAAFLGYKPCSLYKRMVLYGHLSAKMRKPDKTFWLSSPDVFEKGPVHAGRFERYLSKFNWLALSLLGRKKMSGLFEFDDLELQKEYFDRSLNSRRLKLIFEIVFHPRIYKGRGMDEKGLTHSGARNIASFFFSRFRDFCTSTPARKNYLLQLTFYNRILFEEALPEYLDPAKNQIFRERQARLNLFNTSLTEHILNRPAGYFNKFALSNVGDWMSREDYDELLHTIHRQSGPRTKLLSRYIHYAHPVPQLLQDTFRIDREAACCLEAVDRYPFYSLIPMNITVQ